MKVKNYLLLFLLLCNCKSPLTSENVHFKSIYLKKDEGITVALEIKNQNLFSINVENLKYSFWLNDKLIGEGRRLDILKLPPHSTEIFEFPFNFSTDNMLNITWGFQKDTIFIKLEGRYTIKTFIGNFKHNFKTKTKYLLKEGLKKLIEK